MFVYMFVECVGHHAFVCDPALLQAISLSYMIYLDNPHAVDLDSPMKTPYQLSSSNTRIMQSMALLTHPVPGSVNVNHSLLFFGLRDVSTPGGWVVDVLTANMVMKYCLHRCWYSPRPC